MHIGSLQTNNPGVLPNDLYRLPCLERAPARETTAGVPGSFWMLDRGQNEYGRDSKPEIDRDHRGHSPWDRSVRQIEASHLLSNGLAHDLNNLFQVATSKALVRMLAGAGLLILLSISTGPSAARSAHVSTGAAHQRAQTNKPTKHAGRHRSHRKETARPFFNGRPPRRRDAYRDPPFGFANGFGFSTGYGPGCWNEPQYQRLYRWQSDCNGAGFDNGFGFGNGFGNEPWEEE